MCIRDSARAIPIGVVNSEVKRQFCQNMGALALIRSEYEHWGPLLSEELKPQNQHFWREKVKAFVKNLLKLTEGRYPNIVLEHTGEDTFPTSLYVCDKEGMVVTCAGTSGYLGSFDLRYLWLYNKRIQGSHYANPEECKTFNNMVINKSVSPVLSGYSSFSHLPVALQDMSENKHLPGSMAVRIGH